MNENENIKNMPEPIKNLQSQGKLGIFPYVVALLSFIPLLGVLVGIVVAFYGFFTKKKGGKIIAAIGICGIAFTVIIYSSLFYMMNNGEFDGSFKKLSQMGLDNTVHSIEFYKVQNGHYPRTLKRLSEGLTDMAKLNLIDSYSKNGSGNAPSYFYYELIDRNHYYLLSLGKDQMPFTSDDLIPNIPLKQNSKIGLLFKNVQ